MPVPSGENHYRYRHGQAGWRKQTSLYKKWASMLNRCRNEKDPAYKDYGARGIKVCDRWLDFVNFAADMGEPPTPKHTLERDDNNKGYEPGNVTWKGRKEQANNRRTNRMLTFRGRTQTLQQWCEELGMKHNTIVMRIDVYGWDVDRALSTPARPWSPGKNKPPG